MFLLLHSHIANYFIMFLRGSGKREECIEAKEFLVNNVWVFSLFWKYLISYEGFFLCIKSRTCKGHVV